MPEQSPELLKKFNPRKIIWPVSIGIGAALLLIFKDFDREAFLSIKWNANLVFWVFLGVVFMAMRDIAYMYRIQVLTDHKINWRKSFDVIMLWEFASAITPSIVGGTAFALFLLSKEKISAGKTTTIVLFTAFLDEMFFIVTAPLFLLLAGYHKMLPTEFAGSESSAIGGSLVFGFWFGYIALFLYTVFLAYGIFFSPIGLKKFIFKLFSIKFIRKWRKSAVETGQEILTASKDLKDKKLEFWFKAFGSTFASWTARYLVINSIIIAFAVDAPSVQDHFIIYARQVVMWVIMLVTPTPGGSGMAEVVFSNFLSEFIPQGLAPTLAFLWRLLSYYPYLIIGAIVLPRWLNRVFPKQ